VEKKGVWDPTKQISSNNLVEQLDATFDETDYLWYTKTVSIASTAQQISITISKPEIEVISIFLDDEVVASSAPVKKGQGIAFSVSNKDFGKQNSQRVLKILSATAGITHTPAGGRVTKGMFSSSISVNGVDVTASGWIIQSGIQGEAQRNYAPDSKAPFTSMSNPSTASGFSWYRMKIPALKAVQNRRFVLDLSTMGKGIAYVNGKSIGRYWNITSSVSGPFSDTTASNAECTYAGYWAPEKCRSRSGEITQRNYHVPPDWLNTDKENVFVFWEEAGADLSKIRLLEVCSGSCQTGSSNLGDGNGAGLSLLAIALIASEVIFAVLLAGVIVWIIRKRRG
jgi:hypothetical protein